MADTSLTLSWLVPEKDGGSPILDYIIEIRETKADTWTQFGTSTVTHIFVEKLIKDRSYEFRICARNDAGIGPALITEDSIVAGRKISKFIGHFEAVIFVFVLFSNDFYRKPVRSFNLV